MKKMLPVIMNDQFERLALVDDYSSFIWSTRYYESGDFQLIVDASDKYMNLFQKGYYVVRDDDENVGIVEDIVIERYEDGHQRMIITGGFLDAIIGRRIIAVQTSLSGNISACIEQLLMDNIIDPEDTDRRIDGFIINSYTISTTMQAQYTGKNLLEVISSICETYGIGFKVTFNSNHEFVFALYKGVDRTYDQTENKWVIFSDKFNNLLSSEYRESYSSIVNAVLVAGEGEGLDRTTAWVTDGSTGINRYEYYKDQRNVRSDNGEISEDEYLDMLVETGKESLTTYTTAFTGTVYFDSVKYKEDIGIGDLCVIQNSEWGIYINSRLVEVIESVDETGDYSIIPTFGK